MARLKEQLKKLLLTDIIPGFIVLGVFFGSIWIFENYFSHLIR